MTFADRVLDALGPAMRELAGDLLPGLVEALCSQIEDADYLVQPVDGQVGTPLSNLALSPYPRWLSQVAGVTVPPGYTDAQARVLVAGASAASRGTPAAMIAAARATLTGAKQYLLVERDGDPYAVTFATYQLQTPDPVATKNAVISQKPVGLVLNYVNSPGQLYEQTTAEGKTYVQHTATGRTYTARTLTLPNA